VKALAGILVLLALAAPIASPATYHVAQQHPAASDENDGSTARPWKTISKAAKVMRPGDKVVVHAGTYREWVQPENSGEANAPITYEAADGEEVVITGADVFADWTHLPGDRPIYKYEPWKLDSTVHGADAPIGRQEQVICDGKLLKHVMTLEEMSPGTFVSDIENDVLCIYLPGGDEPSKHRIEVSVRNRCFGFRFRGEGRDYIHMRGFTMRYGRNMAQRGILYVIGNNWVIEDNVIEWSNGCGVSIIGEGHLFRNNTSQYHGQLGLGSRPRKCRFENNKLLHNNLKGFSAGWESGGCKIVFANDLLMTGTVAVGNNGPGIWFDIDNQNSTVSRSFCKDNTGPGIFIEISGKGGIKLSNNVCVGNGLRSGNWGAAGILLGESENCTVEHNVLVGNKEGFAFRMQGPRVSPGQDDKPKLYFTHDCVVRHNIIAFNRDYQVAFWVDNPFFGPHPCEEVNKKARPLLDPERLNIVLDHNLYYRPPVRSDEGAKNKCLILYGPGWRPRHERFDRLEEWQKTHGFDRNSVTADPLFVDWKNGDFRLRRNSPAVKMKAGLTEPAAGMTEIVE